MTMFDNLLWGLKWGFVFAMGFTIIALAMTLLSSGEIIEKQGVPLPLSIAVYFGGGAVGGVMLGLLRPLTRRRTGAVLVGIIIMIPPSMMLALALHGPMGAWGSETKFTVLLVALLLGGIGGYAYWEPTEQDN